MERTCLPYEGAVMDLIIKNGTIVTAKEMYKADLGVSGGKIVAIGSNLSEERQHFCVL